MSQVWLMDREHQASRIERALARQSAARRMSSSVELSEQGARNVP
jgi:hypothetical protein